MFSLSFESKRNSATIAQNWKWDFVTDFEAVEKIYFIIDVELYIIYFNRYK